MPIRIFAIKFDQDKGFSDDEAVNRFILGRRLIDLKKEFFIMNDSAYWTVFVEYEEILPSVSDKDNSGLNEWQSILFQRLKEWRKKKANEEGIPVYLIATNNELKNIILSTPKSIEQLKNIRGFGKKKIEKYGRDIISIISDFFKKT